MPPQQRRRDIISDAVMESDLDIEDLEIEVDREPTVYEIGDQVVYPLSLIHI